MWTSRQFIAVLNRPNPVVGLFAPTALMQPHYNTVPASVLYSNPK